MTPEKILNPSEMSELKEKKDFINIVTLASMWVQVGLAFALFIQYPNPFTFLISTFACRAIASFPFTLLPFAGLPPPRRPCSTTFSLPRVLLDANGNVMRLGQGIANFTLFARPP